MVEGGRRFACAVGCGLIRVGAWCKVRSEQRIESSRVVKDGQGWVASMVSMALPKVGSGS